MLGVVTEKGSPHYLFAYTVALLHSYLDIIIGWSVCGGINEHLVGFGDEDESITR